jgi:hypothetical protein
MKKILTALAVALVASCVWAAMDASTINTAVVIEPAAVAAGATSTNTVIDKNDLGDGVANFVFSVATVTNALGTGTFIIQTANASTGTFASVKTNVVTGLTNAAAKAAVAYDLTSGKRYIRVLASANTNSAITVGGVVLSFP